jgi:non-specific serine/threonine protein kinase/serine/threonine-protein kinase
MNEAERWSRVSDVLSRALDLPERERTAFLAEAIRERPELRTEIQSMLEELPGAEGFLERPPSPANVVDSFGSYRVLGELGEGGMGIVYLAERSDGQFTRRVAIKRIGSAAPDSELLRRFRDERQILARLDHPNIARLLDAGLDATGVPYLVMEHVEGVRITSFCREKNLGVRERLALFLKVCAAVQHAHQHLVIHRDIKPGNILVTPEGEPKLLDFGIAKLLITADSGDATRTVHHALTFDFASPEQMRGEPVSTASDVYSLGVVLFELLADVKPYECGAGGLSEAVRLVCEFVPPPPSHVAPKERRAALAGDLDGIVRRALEKSSSDRYPTAADLADDVSAHLDHRPVLAQHASLRYLAKKFVRRHRAAVATATVVAILLAAGVTAVLWQARVAEHERSRAQARFEDVREIANYVIFDLQDGIAKLAGATALRRQMVERSLRYLDSLAAEAAGDVELQKEIAGAYVRLGDVLGRQNVANLGDYPGAIASYRKAEETLRSALVQNPTDAETRRSLGRVLLNLTMAYNIAEDASALGTLEDSMRIWQELVREDPSHEENLRGLASAQFSMAIQLHESGGNAVLHMERALELFQKLLDARPDDLDRKRNVALCHKQLAGYFVIGNPERAQGHSLAAARLDSERLATEPHNAQAKLDYTFDLGTLGDQHLPKREYDEALRYFEEALALRRELWEADRANVYSRNRLAFSLARVGLTHVLAGRHRLARPLLHESVEHARETPEQSGSFPILANAYLFLGEVELASGRDPCSWYGRMADVLPLVQDAAFIAEALVLRDRALQYMKSCAD